jgi:DNA-binding HxlR family transcriptional regulator
VSSEPAHRQAPTVLDLLGRRWMPNIIHELAVGALGFRELRRRCGSMSSSVLSQRLHELADAGLAGPDEFGSWELTDSGATIGKHLAALVESALNQTTDHLSR